MIVSAERLGRQLAAIFRGWGMSDEHVAVTVETMLAADLSGIDSIPGSSARRALSRPTSTT